MRVVTPGLEKEEKSRGIRITVKCDGEETTLGVRPTWSVQTIKRRALERLGKEGAARRNRHDVVTAARTILFDDVSAAECLQDGDVLQLVEARLPAAAELKRERLPDERRSLTQRFVIHGERRVVKLYLTTGFYPDGRVGEIFVRVAKEGAILQTILDEWAVAVSVGLQYGIPLEVFVEKAEWIGCEPAGMVEGCELVKICKSPIDCMARYLRAKFLGGNPLSKEPVDDVDDYL